MAKDQLEDYSNSVNEQECRPGGKEVKMWETWQDLVAKGICRMRERIQSGVIHILAEMTG